MVKPRTERNWSATFEPGDHSGARRRTRLESSDRGRNVLFETNRLVCPFNGGREPTALVDAPIASVGADRLRGSSSSRSIAGEARAIPHRGRPFSGPSTLVGVTIRWPATPSNSVVSPSREATDRLVGGPHRRLGVNNYDRRPTAASCLQHDGPIDDPPARLSLTDFVSERASVGVRTVLLYHVSVETESFSQYVPRALPVSALTSMRRRQFVDGWVTDRLSSQFFGRNRSGNNTTDAANLDRARRFSRDRTVFTDFRGVRSPMVESSQCGDNAGGKRVGIQRGTVGSGCEETP